MYIQFLCIFLGSQLSVVELFEASTPRITDDTDDADF